MIKLEIKETVSLEIGTYTTFTNIETFKNEDDLKEYLLNYQFCDGDYINEDCINELLETGYSKDNFINVSLKILERK